MTFTASVAPDITEGLPSSLSGNTAAPVVASRGQVQWDISVNGLGFILDISDKHPYRRESAPTQKQQFDASQEAGEQTLDGYWIRSQTSWHLGAGASFYEPGAKDGLTPTQYRYDTSVGIDPWTEGDAKLLKKTDQTLAVAGDSFVAGARVAGADVVFTSDGTALRRYDAAGFSALYSGATPASRIAVTGAKVVVGTATTLAAGDTGGSTLTDLWTGAPSAPSPWWAKSRLIAACGAALYELTLAGGAWPATALFTHPDAGWTWSGVAETPTAIIASGYSGGGSAIYAFTLETDSSGTTPKLGQPFQVAEFPPGEEVHAIYVYLGTYIGIGTSRGLRVGVIADNGSLQYGPLLFETAQPVRSLAARGSFLYAGVEGEIDGGSGCARVSLGSTVGNGLVFPWAWDAQSHTTGAVKSLSFLGTSDRVVMGVSGHGVYTQDATLYEASGYLLSGGVRYGTTEAKAFRYADVRCKTDLTSKVALSIVGPSDEEIGIVSLSNGATGTYLSLANIAQSLEYVAYKLTLTPAAGGTQTPVVQSVALKAVPAVKKQRLIQYPCLLANEQRDPSGTAVFRDVGEVLAALETMESDKAVVTVNDYRLKEQFPATVESLQFSSDTPSSRKPRSSNNVGGRVDITVRRLT